jgi:nitrite reductase/ring-hydroxylating ferredoxin subunit
METTEPLTVPPDGQPEGAQPRWRQDFPVDWPQDEYLSRRDFVKFMALVSLSFTVGQFWILAQDWLNERPAAWPEVDIAGREELPVGGSRVFHYPTADDPALLVRVSAADFVAYDQRCTHLSCPVIPEPQAGRLHCPCHAGVFDLGTGQPLAGPPRRPLRRIQLAVRGDRVLATGLEAEAR